MLCAASFALAVGLTTHGPGHHGHRPAPAAYEVQKMLNAPRWQERDNAAAALRRYDWRSCPEIVDALATTLLRDGHDEVREEAAETLTRLAPCVPCAHQALATAARTDPDHSVRKWARRGLEALSRRCSGPCSACGPVARVRMVAPPRPTAYYVEPAPQRVMVVSPTGAYSRGGSSQFEQNALPDDSRRYRVPERELSPLTPGYDAPALVPLPPEDPDVPDLEPPVDVPLPPALSPTSYRRSARPNLAPLLAAPRGTRVVLTR